MNAGVKHQSRSREEKKILVEQWKQSGKSKKEFVQENNLSYQSFMSWFDKKSKLPDANPFIPLEIKKESHNGIFAEVVLKNGSRVCFHERVGAEYFQMLLK